MNGDGGFRLVNHVPEQIRNDIALFLRMEAQQAEDLPDSTIAAVVHALADAVQNMPVHPLPQTTKELTVAFMGKSGCGKSVLSGAMARMLRAHGFQVRHREEPCVLTVSDGTANLGRNLAKEFGTR